VQKTKRETMNMSNIEPKPIDAPQTIPIVSDVVRHQMDSMATELTKLRSANAALTEENKFQKQQLAEVGAKMDSELRADIIPSIMANSKLGIAELEHKTTAELITFDQILAASNVVSPNYKSIRAGSASINPTRLTVGDLYGKTPKEIAAMEGL
jgi:hypothetical protein